MSLDSQNDASGENGAITSPRSANESTISDKKSSIDVSHSHSLDTEIISPSLLQTNLTTPPPPQSSFSQPKLIQSINSTTPIPSTSGYSDSFNNIPQEAIGNAVTVIEVQSGVERHNCETEINIKDKVSVTMINVNGETSPQSSSHPEQSVSTPIVKGLGRDSQEKEDEGRGTIRLGHGSRYPSENFDDNASEISSVVNNPSVISQMPDRYGFLGGEQYTHESEPEPSPEIVRRREIKWLTMLDKWDHYMRKDFKTVRSRCRKGIPRSMRGRAWYYLCGAAYLKNKNPDVFSQLCEREGKPECIEDIKKDLHRQFPWHEIFAEEGHGQQDLYNVLKAYSILNEKDGYCQAQAPIAAILLMHMPSEDAFWCLVAICEKYLKGYYSPGMQQLQLDGDILFGLLKRVAPPVYKHLKKQKIDPVLYMTEWFLCAFTRTLPWTSVLRVWDSFLCEGVKVLFRVGLILLKYTLGRTGVLKQCPTMYDTLMMVKNLPNYVTHEQFLVVQVQRLDISDDQMRREHYKQVTKRKKAQQKAEAAKKQQQKSSSVSTGVNNIPVTTTVLKSHETAL